MALALTDVCPPATAEDVARFVEYVAGEELEARTERVRAVESYVYEEESPATRAAPLGTAKKPPWIPGLAFGVTFVSLIVSAWAYVHPATHESGVEVSSPEPQTSNAVIEMPAYEVEGESEPVMELDDTTRSTEKRAVRPAPRAAARPKPSCDPPYMMDEKGKKHYKPECL